VLDEDTMASDSATKVPTQQSVKAYVDASTGDPIAISDTTPAETRPFWFKSDTGQLLISYDGTYVEPAAGVSIGMPTAGTTGQVLVKSSGDDFDTEWADAGGGIAAPPSDGNYYAYKDGGWVNITNKIINP
jgi:hypothetical protein